MTNFKPHTGDAYSGAGYAWTFAYVASLQFTQLTNDTTNNAYLVSHFDCGQAGPDNSSTATVDTRAFGDLPLEIFVEKGTAACKTLGMARADAQWAGTADTAITPDARYWSDDMFMITGLQDFGYRATQTEKYLDRTALTMVAYLTALQQSDGLMWHTKQTMAKWGRANGWFAAGMALLLQDLPSSNTNRATIMAGYKKMMDGLLPVQIASGTDAGAWRQVLDRTDAGAEMSCTAMFTYALVTGLKNGWISGAQYVTAAKNGWTALGNKTQQRPALPGVPGNRAGLWFGRGRERPQIAAGLLHQSPEQLRGRRSARSGGPHVGGDRAAAHRLPRRPLETSRDEVGRAKLARPRRNLALGGEQIGDRAVGDLGGEEDRLGQRRVGVDGEARGLRRRRPSPAPARSRRSARRR